jgi:predicted nucleic acid-binding protein
MILLDTNVISEPMRVADGGVVAWIDAQPIETLYLAAITVAELRFGVAAMPAGKRRDALHDHLEKRVLPLFTGRVLPFDLAASQAYAELMARARGAGRAIGVSDGYIAAIASVHALSVATRDTSPFEAAGLTVINPWIA